MKVVDRLNLYSSFQNKAFKEYITINVKQR